MINRELAGETCFFLGLFVVALCYFEKPIRDSIRDLAETGIFDLGDLL